MESIQITAALLSTPVSALGMPKYGARPGILCDFTGLKEDLSNISEYVHYEETDTIWTPADGDMSRIARCPLTRKDLYKAGEKVVVIVFGKKGSGYEVEYRNFFTTANTTVLGKKVAGVDATTLQDFLKMVAGKTLKCLKIERHAEDVRTNNSGTAVTIPSFIWGE